MDASKVPATNGEAGKEGDAGMSVPGVLYVGPVAVERPERHIVAMGPAAGWMKPRGIGKWEREIAVVARASLSDDVRQALGATLPEEQVPSAKHPLTARAAAGSPLLGVARSLVDKLVEKGVRVHTVGFDRMSGGFYYLADGGGSPVRVQGDLFEMIGPALAAGAGENADIDRLLDGLIDRLLQQVSNGLLDELSVELAAALPKLAADGSGLADVDLDAFEREAADLAKRGEKLGDGPEELAAALRASGGNGNATSVKVPIFGEANREEQRSLTVEASGQSIELPARSRWFVSGVVSSAPVLKPPVATTTLAATPVAKRAETRPEDAVPAAAAPAPSESKPAESRPEESKPAESKPADVKPAESKPTDTSPKPARAVPRPTRSGQLPATRESKSDLKPVEAPKPAEVAPSQPVAEAAPAPAAVAAPAPAPAEKPVEAKPVEAKPVEAKPVEPKPAVANPVDPSLKETKVEGAKAKAASAAKKPESKASEAKPAEKKPAEGKAVDKRAANEGARASKEKAAAPASAPAAGGGNKALLAVIAAVVVAVVLWMLMKK